MGPLDDVWEWYRFACESIKLSARQVRVAPESIPPQFRLACVPRQAAVETLARTRAELDDLTVLALFAVFEKALVDHVSLASESLRRRAGIGLEASLAARALQGVERWPLDDVLDTYKSAVDPKLVGLVKQVKDYRDWVAHGKKGQPDASIDPPKAYERLAGFLSGLPHTQSSP